MWRAALVALLSWQACAISELTEVVVLIETEAGLRARSESLSVKVTTAPASNGGPSELLLNNSNTPWNEGRYTLVLSPRAAHAEGRYVVEASALEAGQTIATARLISGYVRGETRYVRMLLEDECVGMLSCGSGTTCRAGACVGADVDPTQFAPNSDLAPTDSMLTPATRAPADAAVSTVPDAAIAAQQDAASDAMVRVDADTAVPSTPDAGVPASSGAALCKPGYYEGAWMGDYAYSSFGLKTDTKIESSSTSDARVLSLVLSADGPSKLRITAGCVSSTMVTGSSRRPFKSRLQGGLDCGTGKLSGSLAGSYLLVDNTDLEYAFSGSLSAVFEPGSSTLRDGVWNAAQPVDSGDYSEGAGQGSWSVSWKSALAPSVSVDPCAELPSP